MKNWEQIAINPKQAKAYDEFEEIIHGKEFTAMRKAIVDCISISCDKDFKVLDCGTGTGDMLPRVVKKFPNAKITGVDASDCYLSIAKEKIKKLGFSNRIILKNINLNEGVPGWIR